MIQPVYRVTLGISAALPGRNVSRVRIIAAAERCRRLSRARFGTLTDRHFSLTSFLIAGTKITDNYTTIYWIVVLKGSLFLFVHKFRTIFEEKSLRLNKENSHYRVDVIFTLFEAVLYFTISVIIT